MKIKTIKLLALTAALPLGANAQNVSKGIQLHGSIQTEFLVPEEDEKIGTDHTNNDLLNNTYLDLNLGSKYVDAGARLEYMEYPLPGFDTEFKGWGVPHLYVKGKVKGAELTIGDFYEQFGSGFILRTYEERALGIDNALRGARVKVNAVDGLRLTALGGVQRTYWDWDTDSRIFGADAEYDLDQHIKALRNNGINWMVGASWVLKNEENALEDNMAGMWKETVGNVQTTYVVNYPKNVNAFDVRTQLGIGGFNVLTEYAYKSQDPSAPNTYTFHSGNAEMLSVSYSEKGFSALLQAKRSESMAFRSQRDIVGDNTNANMGYLNHMPAFAYQHTYALPALRPYATQYGIVNDKKCVPGEWAYQGEVAYNFKKKTTFGGKYGTKVKVNASYIKALDCERVEKRNDLISGTDGYKAKFFGTGDLLYSDMNLQLEKKFTKDFKLNFMYMYQDYNKSVIEGEGGMIHSNIFVADGRYQISKKTTLRAELQYLATKHQSGDWWYGLVELTVLPNLMFTASDMFGLAESAPNHYTEKRHYYMGSVTYTKNSHRCMLGYGLTRRGFDCSGGVCREVPATKGLRLTYNYTF